VFQDPYGSLSPGLNVGQTLAEPLIAQPGLARKDVDRRLRDLIERVGLRPDILRRYPREFSGGQRQRIAIARALALRPSLIVCDEPVSALDLTTQKIVLDLLVDVQRDTGVSYLFITHDLSVVRYISHRVAVLRHGAIVEHGETVAVTEHPSHPYTRQLLLASPLPDVRRQRERRELRRAPTPTTLEPQEVP
jgi:peptide/nickel transport system ATP-binding protein